MRGAFNNSGFLELYRDLPVLWDRNNVDYKNRAARAEAEKKMMETFNFDCARELRNKIRSLRNTYNLELQRINASIKNGASVESVYTPKLVWFNLADSFLGKNLDEASNSWADAADNGLSYEDGGADTDPHEAVAVKTEEPSRRKLKRRAQRRQNRPFVSVEPGTSYQNQSSSYQTSEEVVGANEFVVFGQHVAIQLEKLPLEVSIRLQGEIQALLTKARLQNMRQGGYEIQYLQENEQDPISSDDST